MRRLKRDPEVVMAALGIAALAVLVLMSVLGYDTSFSGQTGCAAPIYSTSTADELESRDKIICLNSATATELTRLDGIGEALAQRMIAYRTEHGGFESKEELMNIYGIGEKTYLKIAPYIVLDEPEE